MLDRPIPVHAGFDTDPLSAVLRAVRLRGALFFLVEAREPWARAAPPGHEIAPILLPGAEHVIEYHVITRGACYASLLDGEAARVEAGDVIVFPQGDAHVVSTKPGMRARVDLDEWRALGGERPPFRAGNCGNRSGDVQVVCGFLGCDARPFNPLLATLPRMLHVRGGSEPRNGVLQHLVHLALEESREPSAGGQSVIARLSELLFIEIVRHHLRSLPATTAGWLAGLRDADVGRALTLLHASPARDWTLESLAEGACSSRSTLAERFKDLVGLPPMQYLAQWRMQIASGRLLDGDAGVASVAMEVGYGSEAAFSRAFKKLVGVAPGEWRRRRQVTAGDAIEPQ